MMQAKDAFHLDLMRLVLKHDPAMIQKLSDLPPEKPPWLVRRIQFIIGLLKRANV